MICRVDAHDGNCILLQNNVYKKKSKLSIAPTVFLHSHIICLLVQGDHFIYSIVEVSDIIVFYNIKC